MHASARIKQSLIAFSFGTLAAGSALAQTAPAAPPPPEHTLTANVGLFSQYVFRGLAQTAGKPAVQGGFDYGHVSGFYLGTWASNISWLEDFGAYTKSSLEWDFYGGYKANFPGSEDWTYDIGTLFYYYPGSKNSGVTNANTWEVYGAIAWKWLSFKASYNVQDYFGIQNSDGTWYFDVSAAYPFGESGVSLLAHYGHTDVNHNSAATYDDWKVGLSYAVPEGLFKGVEIGAYYSGSNGDKNFYTDLNGYNTAKDTGVVYVKKTF